MESDLGKLFVGGISWDTDEDRLKEYFGTYGEVVEAVIMRDRLTGRARGFGFIVFADPAVAERVVLERHIIDGRTVEAKKAVPRDDHHISQRNTSSIHGSPGPGRTKKIFVGGLASSVTESDFKKYFDQFGTITDVVVMYDHNTQRPRGFGFITYDSEEAVDRVLHKTFHELNGKMVEVKRAVPKELSPGPSRSPLVGYNYNMNRSNTLLSYAPGYNVNSLGGYGVRMDRFGTVSSNRSGYPPLANSGYGMSVNMDPGMSPSYSGNSYFSNNLGYGRMLSPYYSGNSNRFTSAIGYNGANGRSDSVLSSTNRDLWGYGGLNNPTNLATAGAYLSSGSGSFGVSVGNSGTNWGTLNATHSGGSSSGQTSGIRSDGNNYGFGGGIYGRNSGTGVASMSSLAASNNNYERPYADLYQNAHYGDPTWRSASAATELEDPRSLGFDLGNGASEAVAKNSEDYIGSYSVANRQSNRGIVT